MAGQQNWGERWEVYNNEHTWNLIDTLFALADELGKSVAQLALRWVMQGQAVTAPIIGVRTMRHLEDNLGATGWALDEAQMARLDAASAHPRPIPMISSPTGHDGAKRPRPPNAAVGGKKRSPCPVETRQGERKFTISYPTQQGTRYLTPSRTR